MQLKTIWFAENWESPQHWSISDLSLNKKNLIVGKNASGKTRSVGMMAFLAKILTGAEFDKASINYMATFEHGNSIYKLNITIQNGEVIEETVTIDEEIKLHRLGPLGMGLIWTENVNGGEHIAFQTPTTSLAVVARRDKIQHEFLEPLYKWASSVRYYPFSSYLGKEHYAVFIPNGPKVDDRDFNAVNSIFREGVKRFGNEFKEEIKSDLHLIDYHIDEIDLRTPISVIINGPFGEPVGLFVKETNLPGITDQTSMSVGMFRVLSLLVQLTYSKLSDSASTIIIDDIGEGLDFDRSCKLINLLRDKAEKSEIQLIMTTNDKFVMNEVPLEEWSVIVRNANHVIVKNYENSKNIFEEFKYTGLSNFTFLEMDVVNS